MTTILLLSLTLAGTFLCWMITLYRLGYWRDRALYAESLERARYGDQNWLVNLQNYPSKGD